MKDRKEILLRAAYDLLKRSTQDHYVREATSILTRFDEADCDGYCLMEDIAAELGLDDDTEPIPLGDTNACEPRQGAIPGNEERGVKC
jgi:hypothetical protein